VYKDSKDMSLHTGHACRFDSVDTFESIHLHSLVLFATWYSMCKLIVLLITHICFTPKLNTYT
jgi:hypothetical protein